MKSFFRATFKIILILTILAECATTEEIKETDPVKLLNQGIALGREGQYDLSIAFFNKAIEINPSCAEVYYNRGLSYKNKGHHFKAISDYTKAIELSPMYYAAYNNRGNAYCAKGKYDKAISDYSKSIELNPWNAMTYSNRGIAYDKKSQYDKAISDLNKAIELNPGYADAYNYKAWMLATCQNTIYRDGAKAVELAKKAVKLDPNNQNLNTLAAAYAEVGKFEDAMKTQKKVIDSLKKEGKPKHLINQCVEHLKSYKANKPWREK